MNLHSRQISLLHKYHLDPNSPDFLQKLEEVIEVLKQRIEAKSSGQKKFKVLTDIQGWEDHHGDMDFKVAGTEQGLTALQLDNKVSGLVPEVLKQALQQARQARLHILQIMRQTIAKPSAEISEHAPRVLFIQVPLEKLGDVIGPAGKTIKALENDYNVRVDLDNDTGKCFIYSKDITAAQECLQRIKELIKDYKPGELIKGRVYRLESYGAFVKIIGDSGETEKEAMIHISNLPNNRRRVEDVLSLGQIVEARIIEINARGQISLSLK